MFLARRKVKGIISYNFSMRERLTELNSELSGLTEIILKQPLSRYEYRAVECTLQALIEACIGIAKHWSYAINKTAAEDTYSAFENLSQVGIDDIQNVPWKKIIGMRNALFHDYLNIEPEIIQLMIKNEGYIGLLALERE